MTKDTQPLLDGDRTEPDMRLILIGQIHNLIDIGERYAARMQAIDPDEQRYAEGAVDHARKVVQPYAYNGPTRDAQGQAAQPVAAEGVKDAIKALEADRDSWAQQASDRLDDALRFARERDEALASLKAAREEGFSAGWRTAANWMNRDDLIADIGSAAYTADRDSAIRRLLEDGKEER